ncbi:hypothetical protein [Kribbella sp. CA-294648]|uniref:hypothetical protein n=1 Tax=Kribbella sp. CA-294648 TaxID=3239948 RepID=UPI003D8D39F6
MVIFPAWLLALSVTAATALFLGRWHRGAKFTGYALLLSIGIALTLTAGFFAFVVLPT